MLDQTVNPVVEDITAQVSSHPEFSNHMKVFQITDEASGLKARIAIHSLIEGRSLGGCRRWEYESDAAWNADILRLSRGMTRKSAVAGLPLGGAKAAINHGHPTAAMMRAFGRGIAMIETQFGMVYITAEDVGISEALLIEAKKETEHVRGIAPVQKDVELAGGDPGPYTAYGVFTGIKVAVKYRLGKESLKGLGVAVQGLGDVGYSLCEFLHKEGAKLVVADLDGERLQRAVDTFGAMPVMPHEILSMDVDVVAPCAMGGVLDENIRAPIVAGSANNQQKDEINNAESRSLKEKNILYAPDYVINSGGLISVYYEGETKEHVMGIISKQVEMTLDRIFMLSQKEGLDTATLSDQLAENLLQDKVSFETVFMARMVA
ncbi:MAG: amino acid dehydrogenase [Alphaproteobacteria bacterium CG_4_9_14_3_um_filter_47_13]|nr:MAG: amino acid dehydrogenase [Alphaproteobacteria bacterium CG_4_9_14_3_um_filter_47_13]